MVAAAFPQYAGDYRKVQVRPACADVILTQEQRERLRLAYEGMCARREKITSDALRKAARVSYPAAIAYLYHLRGGSVA